MDLSRFKIQAVINFMSVDFCSTNVSEINMNDQAFSVCNFKFDCYFSSVLDTIFWVEMIIVEKSRDDFEQLPRRPQ